MANHHGQPHAAETRTMSDLLMAAPESDVLTDDVLAKLDSAWGGLPVTEIAERDKVSIVKEFLEIFTDADGYTRTLRLQIAEEVITLIERFGYGKSTPTRPAPGVSTVRIERNFSEMSLRQLLEAIIADPSVYAEAARYISSHTELQYARAKTYKWVVPLDDDGTGIDLEATMHYVLELNKPHTVVQRRINGRRPVWLGHAMGVNDLPLIHPITGRLVQGPDVNGFDWSTRSRELLEAVLWARKTGHSLLPDLHSDQFGYSEQLFQEPLPRRWQNILDDYLDARDRRESTTDGIRADWPEDLPFDSVFTFTITVKAAVVDYESLVRAYVLSPLRKSGSNIEVRRGPYTTIDVCGSNIEFHGTIVIEGGRASGSNADGTIYVPPGVYVTVTGSNNDTEVITVTWEWIARKLGLV